MDFLIWGAVAALVALLIVEQGVIATKLQELRMALEKMQQAIERTGTLADAAITLIHSLRDQIKEILDKPGNHDAAFSALADELNAKADAIAAALVEHAEEDAKDEKDEAEGEP